MNIGIIVHSKTGNTYSAAERIKKELSDIGHQVTLEKVIPLDDKSTTVAEKVRLKSAPGTEEYDAIIFGAPVWGFKVSAVMEAYLSQIKSLKDKKVACFVTQSFPFPWLGGNNSTEQMKRICESKGAVVAATGTANRTKKYSSDNLAGKFKGFF